MIQRKIQICKKNNKKVVDSKICSCYLNKVVRQSSVAQQVEHSPFKG